MSRIGRTLEAPPNREDPGGPAKIQHHFGDTQMKIAAILLCAVCALAQQPEGHTASVNGIDMYYEVSGSGPPLVLLHGFGGSGQDWSCAASTPRNSASLSRTCAAMAGRPIPPMHSHIASR